MIRWLTHLGIFTLLTILTQLGGLAWILSRATQRPLIAFLILYATFSAAAYWSAPAITNRVPIPCFGTQALRSQSVLYCALNRHYVNPELFRAAQKAADDVATRFPGTQTRSLDAGFPFLTGFPLLPHLSHDDGEKLDLALYWRSEDGYQPGKSRFPMGYWGYADGSTNCPARWTDLRWDWPWLNSILPAMRPDVPRLTHLLSSLRNDPVIGKILLEPHLQAATALNSEKIRFQGCRAARHDDHIHIQLR